MLLLAAVVLRPTGVLGPLPSEVLEVSYTIWNLLHMFFFGGGAQALETNDYVVALH